MALFFFFAFLLCLVFWELISYLAQVLSFHISVQKFLFTADNRAIKAFCCTQSCATLILKAPLAAETVTNHLWLCNEAVASHYFFQSECTSFVWLFLFFYCYVLKKNKYLSNWKISLRFYLKRFLIRKFWEMRTKYYVVRDSGLYSWFTIMLHFLYCKGKAVI